MKNDTKLIMETWRKFINETSVNSEEPVQGYYDDEYNPDGYDPDAEMQEPVQGYYDDEYNPDGYDPDIMPEERYGQYGDPEDPNPVGPRVEADPNEFNNDEVSMEDESEDDYYGHDFDSEPEF